MGPTGISHNTDRQLINGPLIDPLLPQFQDGLIFLNGESRLLEHTVGTGSAFYQQKLFDHPFICLVRQDHPTIGDTIDLDQFLSCEHMVVNQEGRRQEIAEKVMRRLGLRRKIVLHSPHFLSVPAIIARSDLIAIVPKAVGTMMGGLPGLKMLPPSFPIPRIEVKQTWHRRVNTDPANTWLRRIVIEIFQRQGPTLAD